MWWPTDIISLESWILLATIFLLIWYYFHRKWQFLAKLNIPHDPPSILTYGNASTMFHKHDCFTVELALKKKYGLIYGYYMGTTPTISIHDVEILRQIFVKEFSSFPIREINFTKAGGRELNQALTAVSGEPWKRIRATMTPTFSTSKLKQMTGITEWCADNAVEVLNRKIQSSEGIFNPRELFSRLSLDMICSSAFSTKVHSQDDSKKESLIAYHANKLVSVSFMSPLIMLVLLFPKLEDLMDKYDWTIFNRKALDYFKDLTEHVIKQRNQNDQSRVDLMQLMLDSEISEAEQKTGTEKGMTKTEIIGNSMLMILAGFENTASAMQFVSYNLATHPEIQREVQREIDEMIRVHGKFDYEGINDLKLLTMCLNETLRLYNPILRNSRVSVKDITINGLHIPKGTLVNVPVFALSHDPEYWDEPWVFKPERMRDLSQIDPMVFQPFGAGPRNCIGMRFAIMEIKMSLCKILHKFNLEPTAKTPKPPLKLVFGISTRPAENFDLRAVPRESAE